MHIHIHIYIYREIYIYMYISFILRISIQPISELGLLVSFVSVVRNINKESTNLEKHTEVRNSF